jgi:hypothetical protein
MHEKAGLPIVVVGGSKFDFSARLKTNAEVAQQVRGAVPLAVASAI